MAASVSSLNVTEEQVRMFVSSLLGRKQLPASSAGKGTTRGTNHYALLAAAAAASSREPPTPADDLAPASSSAGGRGGSSTAALPMLRLHPRIDAVHPLGEAHSSEELVNALKLYRQMVKDVRLEVEEVMVGPDKALVTGHQVVSSHLTEVTHQLPYNRLPGQLQHLVHEFLPSLTDGRVPTAIQMRFGKSDAGEPVVTQMSVTFSLLAVLLPHLTLRPWQQHLLQQLQQQLLHTLMSTGSLAAVLEDISTSAGATWRASAAMMKVTVGRIVAEVRDRMQGAAAAGLQRAASDGLNGAHP